MPLITLNRLQLQTLQHVSSFGYSSLRVMQNTCLYLLKTRFHDLISFINHASVD